MGAGGERELVSSYLQKFGVEAMFPAQLIASAKLVNCGAGDKIAIQGEMPDELLLLVEGKIKVFTTMPDGKSLILSFLNPLEVIGDIEYVQRGMELMNTVEVVSPVTMIRFSYRHLDLYGLEQPGFLRFLLEIITRKFKMKNNSLSFNLLYPVEVRLASYLLSVCYDGAEESGQPTARLEAGALHDAANLIGTSYRHLNRVLLQFAEDGLIERKRSSIAVKDRTALAAIARENIYELQTGGL
ncbi:cyclic nucleotide-binding domain-containing protein [Paenibacillus pasadenensis]|uniref:Crp/Fnr family transcriptional regulator n=1 Tax=Paenibacillus pasadenensis TaxID=217090 RepID=UPI00203B3B22|nr:cyclic nucleotide-binding domain-containing protein [Paenibacillus pasadenensis]MCM3745753.1 cyclic nucleotide-binding domain-containing protein [Paenibacillus pasadenensis]